LDGLWADGFAGSYVGAASEELLIHLGHHFAGARFSLRLALRQQAQVRDLGGYK
jgi:hypothetical protein